MKAGIIGLIDVFTLLPETVNWFFMTGYASKAMAPKPDFLCMEGRVFAGKFLTVN